MTTGKNMKKIFLILAAAGLLASCGQTKKESTKVEEESVQPQKLIALSFDDGPNTTTTVNMLDMLEKHDVKGSFFVIGQNINDESAAVMKRAFDMGCDIENHSFTHSNMQTLSVEQIKEEIQKTTELIEKHVGVSPQFFRPPFISHNQDMHDNIDLTFICGAGVEDWVPAVSAEERAKRMLEAAGDGVIYLLHDMPGNEATVQALDVVIPQLKEQGYQFVTVPEIFKAKGITPVKNKIYTNVLND